MAGLRGRAWVELEVAFVTAVRRKQATSRALPQPGAGVRLRSWPIVARARPVGLRDIRDRAGAALGLHGDGVGIARVGACLVVDNGRRLARCVRLPETALRLVWIAHSKGVQAGAIGYQATVPADNGRGRATHVPAHQEDGARANVADNEHAGDERVQRSALVLASERPMSRRLLTHACRLPSSEPACTTYVAVIAQH